jgi:hypothetical protein
MALSRREQETIIVFDEEDKIASVEVPVDMRLDWKHEDDDAVLVATIENWEG